MDSTSSILVAVCGVGVVCCGGLGLALLTLGRGVALPLVVGVINALRGVPEVIGGDDEDEFGRPVDDRQRGDPRARRGLRDRIQAANDEFNRALKGEHDYGPDDRPASQRPSLRRPRSAFEDPPDTRGLRRNPGRPRRDTRHSERHEDEIFGGMLDE